MLQGHRNYHLGSDLHLQVTQDLMAVSEWGMNMLPVTVLDPTYGTQVTTEMQNLDSDLPSYC